MKIAVIGTGYVGLVTGTCLADFGNQVICVDRDSKKIDLLLKGESPIYEPGLATLLQKNNRLKRIHFTTDLQKAVAASDFIFLAVGTPMSDNGEADMSQVFGVVEELCATFKQLPSDSDKFIITKSTVPVGTGQQIKELLSKRGLSMDTLHVVSNPEFLREGSAIYDFQHPDRIIIGVETEKARQAMHQLYRPIYRRDEPIVFTNLETSELIKYASNAFLATKISFINEMATLCEHVGADVSVVAKGMGMDGRIGKYFLHPGPGYGGSCFPKDTRALLRIGEKHGQDIRIVRAAEDVNSAQKQVAIRKLKAEFSDDLTGRTIGVLGLAFKPNTDDVRETPAYDAIKGIIDAGGQVKAFDPIASETFKACYQLPIYYADSELDAATDVDALLVMTEWNDFREIDLSRLKTLMKSPLIIDTRNIYDPKTVARSGMRYIPLGRPENV